MKILLVQSYLGGGEPPVFPLGLACIRPGLGKHEARGFDPNVHENPFEELKRVIRDFRPDAVGVSLRNIDSTNKRRVVFYYEFFKKMLGEIRSVTDAKIIAGGSGFSMFAGVIMEDEPRIDYGVYLEGEFIIADLLDNLGAPEKVKGVYYRKDGKVRFTGPSEPADLKRLPPPDRDLNPVAAYKDVPEAVGIETKRGCALKCVYCIYGFLNGRRYRFRAPEKIVDEIETLGAKYGIDSFTFVDSVFNIPLKHAEAICREILRRGIKPRWSAWFSESGLTREFVELCGEAGCRKVILSPDGFSDAVLKALGKNITRDDIEKAYAVLKETGGFEVCYNFFKNPPGQTLSSFLSMAGFCLKARAGMGRRVHFEFNSMRIEPHTKLYEIALKEGMVEKGDDLLYPRYYTNPGTAYIERFMNLAMRLKGK
ncbi:MAG: radical SAM protein [Deltaproteobacteria bacterium]|nr:radical SAM protein [Deltaproteobacteria bacterium]